MSNDKLLRVYAKKKPPVSVSQPGELVIRVHLPINCSQIEHHIPDKFVQRSIIFLNKKTPVGVNLLGERVIRVHLPIIFSRGSQYLPEKMNSIRVDGNVYDGL